METTTATEVTIGQTIRIKAMHVSGESVDPASTIEIEVHGIEVTFEEVEFYGTLTGTYDHEPYEVDGETYTAGPIPHDDQNYAGSWTVDANETVEVVG